MKSCFFRWFSVLRLSSLYNQCFGDASNKCFFHFCHGDDYHIKWNFFYYYCIKCFPIRPFTLMMIMMMRKNIFNIHFSHNFSKILLSITEKHPISKSIRRKIFRKTFFICPIEMLPRSVYLYDFIISNITHSDRYECRFSFSKSININNNNKGKNIMIIIIVDFRFYHFSFYHVYNNNNNDDPINWKNFSKSDRKNLGNCFGFYNSDFDVWVWTAVNARIEFVMFILKFHHHHYHFKSINFMLNCDNHRKKQHMCSTESTKNQKRKNEEKEWKNSSLLNE